MNKIIIGIAALLILSFTGFGIWDGLKPGPLDAFAQCVSNKGVQMYGAYWCEHCINNKKAFGPSFKYINYVECSLQNGQGMTQECQEKGIQGYPTWQINGEMVSGEVSLEQLSQKTGCELPKTQ